MACADVRSWVTNGLGAEVPPRLTFLRNGECVDARALGCSPAALSPVVTVSMGAFLGDRDDLCLANGRRVEREVASSTRPKRRRGLVAARGLTSPPF